MTLINKKVNGLNYPLINVNLLQFFQQKKEKKQSSMENFSNGIFEINVTYLMKKVVTNSKYYFNC